LYVYPVISVKDRKLKHSSDLPIPKKIQFLYRHLVDNQEITDVQNYTEENLIIYSKTVLKMIHQSLPGWEKMVPKEVEDIIKEKKLFGFE
jgi:hypothetical protein